MKSFWLLASLKLSWTKTTEHLDDTWTELFWPNVLLCAVQQGCYLSSRVLCSCSSIMAPLMAFSFCTWRLQSGPEPRPNSCQPISTQWHKCQLCCCNAFKSFTLPWNSDQWALGAPAHAFSFRLFCSLFLSCLLNVLSCCARTNLPKGKVTLNLDINVCC